MLLSNLNKSSSQIIIFTDLDGTLLDHETYSWDAANPALDLIHEHNIPLILNSSKTKDEQLQLRAALNNSHPFIVENGGAVIIPEFYFNTDHITRTDAFNIEYFGIPHEQLIEAINEYRHKNTVKFSGFSDMSVEEICACTGLDSESSARAKARTCTEPLLWQDSEKLVHQLRDFLHEHGLQLVKGGRFYHVMGQFSKADGVKWLIKQYAEFYKQSVISIALGDSPNDAEMLNAVDYPIVIPAHDGIRLRIDHPNVIYAKEAGPAGWREGLLHLLQNQLK